MRKEDYNRPLRHFVVATLVGIFIIMPMVHAVQGASIEYERDEEPPDAREESSPENSLSDKERYMQYARTQSKEHGVSWRWVKFLINCETAGTWDPEIQSRHYIGTEREQSYGLAQIFLPVNPNITYAQATDPYFAIDFIVSETLNGNYPWRWRNCRELYLNKYY